MRRAACRGRRTRPSARAAGPRVPPPGRAAARPLSPATEGLRARRPSAARRTSRNRAGRSSPGDRTSTRSRPSSLGRCRRSPRSRPAPARRHRRAPWTVRAKRTGRPCPDASQAPAARRPWRPRRCRGAVSTPDGMRPFRGPGPGARAHPRRATYGRTRPRPSGRRSPPRSCRRARRPAARPRRTRGGKRRPGGSNLQHGRVDLGREVDARQVHEPKIPVFGMPIGGPTTASASSTVSPRASASLIATKDQ